MVKSMISDLWDWSWTWTLRKVLGPVPCCGQDDYRVQLPQHPIDTYRYISDNRFICEYVGMFQR